MWDRSSLLPLLLILCGLTLHKWTNVFVCYFMRSHICIPPWTLPFFVSPCVILWSSTFLSDCITGVKQLQLQGQVFPEPSRATHKVRWGKKYGKKGGRRGGKGRELSCARHMRTYWILYPSVCLSHCVLSAWGFTLYVSLCMLVCLWQFSCYFIHVVQKSYFHLPREKPPADHRIPSWDHLYTQSCSSLTPYTPTTNPYTTKHYKTDLQTLATAKTYYKLERQKANASAVEWKLWLMI